VFKERRKTRKKKLVHILNNFKSSHQSPSTILNASKWKK
jgi:hypothetical protein